MFKGFALAVERFEAAAKTQEPDDAYISLFEALGWAVALDSRTMEQWVPDGPHQQPGWEWRARARGRGGPARRPLRPQLNAPRLG
jgi:hypothetical protein